MDLEDLLKRIGAALVGAAEGVGLTWLALAIIESEAEITFSQMARICWCVFGGFFGGVVCFCLPIASLFVFFALFLLLAGANARNSKKDR